MNSKEQQLLSLGFEKNIHQQSWISFKYDQNWYVDFYRVRDLNDELWTDCIESIKNAYQRAKNKIESSNEYRLGIESAEKRIKQQILDLKNKYKSNLQEETHIKLNKEINKDKVNKLLIKLSVIDEIENKL